MNNKTNKPVFTGKNNELPMWAVNIALPWLVQNLQLTAGVICGSVPEHIRREVYGLGPNDILPNPIDWNRNSIVISPPGTGKGMAIFVDALAHFRKIYVVVPAVIQAHKMEESLDYLYHPNLGGCATAQKKSAGVITAITVGILHQMLRDVTSEIWQDDVLLVVDEAQRILDEDLHTQFMIAAAARRGKRICIVSATIAPGNLPTVFGHGTNEEAIVYSLDKQMFPVNIQMRSGEEIGELLRECHDLRTGGTTMLLFAPSRAQIMATVKLLRTMGDHIWPVAVTGAHIVEEQLQLIRRGQDLGKAVVVVGTPGTLDSSVTIPNLTVGGIIDERIRVDWNQYGVTERRREQLPINHIAQMIRRWGRVQRTDGGTDKVYIFSKTPRTDVLAEKYTFEPITGGSKWQPLEAVILEAVGMNIPFAEIHGYMVSDFSDFRILAAYERLLADGAIQRVNDPNDLDGYQLTDKGRTILALPYDYLWSLMIADAYHPFQRYLCIAASFGRLEDLDMFDLDEKSDVAGDPMSEVLRKIRLGIEYINLWNDSDQRYLAQGMDLSFRRLEQMEQLFHLGCDALGQQPSSVRTITANFADELLGYLVTTGLRIGLFDLFFLGKTQKGDWFDVRRTPGMTEGYRKFFISASSLQFQQSAVAGIVAVVATPQWFTDKNGMSGGNMDNISIVPAGIRDQLVMQYAAKQANWKPMKFEQSDGGGRSELACSSGGTRYVPMLVGKQPIQGAWYWCSDDRSLARGVRTVFIHAALPTMSLAIMTGFPDMVTEQLGSLVWDTEQGKVVQEKSISVRNVKVYSEMIQPDHETAVHTFVGALQNPVQTQQFPVWSAQHAANIGVLKSYDLLSVRSGGALPMLGSNYLTELYQSAIAGETLDLESLVSNHAFMGTTNLMLDDLVSVDQQSRILRENPDIVMVAGDEVTVIYSKDWNNNYFARATVTVNQLALLTTTVQLPGGRTVVLACDGFESTDPLELIRLLDGKRVEQAWSIARNSVATYFTGTILDLPANLLTTMDVVTVDDQTVVGYIALEYTGGYYKTILVANGSEAKEKTFAAIRQMYQTAVATFLVVPDGTPWRDDNGYLTDVGSALQTQLQTLQHLPNEITLQTAVAEYNALSTKVNQLTEQLSADCSRLQKIVLDADVLLQELVGLEFVYNEVDGLGNLVNELRSFAVSTNTVAVERLKAEIDSTAAHIVKIATERQVAYESAIASANKILPILHEIANYEGEYEFVDEADADQAAQYLGDIECSVESKETELLLKYIEHGNQLINRLRRSGNVLADLSGLDTLFGVAVQRKK